MLLVMIMFIFIIRNLFCCDRWLKCWLRFQCLVSLVGNLFCMCRVQLKVKLRQFVGVVVGLLKCIVQLIFWLVLSSCMMLFCLLWLIWQLVFCKVLVRLLMERCLIRVMLFMFGFLVCYWILLGECCLVVFDLSFVEIVVKFLCYFFEFYLCIVGEWLVDFYYFGDVDVFVGVENFFGYVIYFLIFCGVLL